MLWSQIKLKSYDFSDVHITGEVDNRPGTGRFLRIFSCMVTYRTGAVRHLYMKTLADARRCRNFSRAIMNTFTSKFAIIPHKKQVVKIRQNEADSDSDYDENHTCSRLQKFQ